VINPLQPILDYPGDLVMFETRASKASKKSAPRNMVYQYQAATMLFDAGCETMTGLYDKFKKHWKLYMKKFRSDQDLMGAWIPNQPMFPKEWMLKLGTCVQLSKKPKDAIIITGQGRIATDGEKERKGDRLFRHLDAIPWLEKAARDTEGGTI